MKVTEQEAQEIFDENLKNYHSSLRLEAIIIKSMFEFAQLAIIKSAKP